MNIMKNKLLLLLIFIGGFCGAQAQVFINEQVEITRAMEKYKQLSMNREYVDGWRIQIINTDDRRQMEAARSKFAIQYPYIKMTWEHVQPYYQVRVGAYHHKMDLESFLRELKDDFPRAIPVRDQINKSELFE